MSFALLPQGMVKRSLGVDLLSLTGSEPHCAERKVGGWWRSQGQGWGWNACPQLPVRGRESPWSYLVIPTLFPEEARGYSEVTASCECCLLGTPQPPGEHLLPLASVGLWQEWPH